MRNPHRLASLTLVAAAGLHVPGVEQTDPFLTSDEQRMRESFHDPQRADDTVVRVLRPEYEDAALKNRTTAAQLTWQPRAYDPHLAQMAAPHRRADTAGVGRERPHVPPDHAVA